MGNKVLTKNNASVSSSGKAIGKVLVALVIPIIAYYTWTRGFVYLNLSKEIYTDYFWYRAPWLLVHVVFSLIAILVGPIQFITKIRLKYPKLHQRLGKIYLGSIVISASVSFYLMTTSQLGIVYAVGLGMLGVVWLCSSGMAYLSIRKKNVAMHKEWMVKSYVLTLSFVFFRFVEDIMIGLEISTFADRKILMAWACWAVPFFFTEVILQLYRLSR